MFVDLDEHIIYSMIVVVLSLNYSSDTDLENVGQHRTTMFSTSYKCTVYSEYDLYMCTNA